MNGMTGGFGTRWRRIAAMVAGVGFIAVTGAAHASGPRIAVLPFDNCSNSMRAPEALRKAVTELLVSRGYEVVPADVTDAILREMGITQGGQVDSKTPRELAIRLGVSALVKGTVTDFRYVTLGFGQSRIVGASVRILNPKGDLIWGGYARISRDDQMRHTGDFGKDLLIGFVAQLLLKFVENALTTPLYPETADCVAELGKTLPRAPQSAPAPLIASAPAADAEDLPLP